MRIMKLNIKIGNVYKIAALRSGHGYHVGEEVKVLSENRGSMAASYVNYGGLWNCEGTSGDAIGLRYGVYGTDLQVPKADRATRLANNKEEIEKAEKRIAELKASNIRLEKFKTDEEETAFLLVTASDGAKSPEERVMAIAQILKERSANQETTEYL